MNKYICQYCLEQVDSRNSLLKHQKNKYCYNYRDIIFSCKKCNFSTIGIKNIEKHTCDYSLEDDDDNVEYILESEDEDDLPDKVDNIVLIKDNLDQSNDTDFFKLQKQLLKLENDLKIEKIKHNYLKSILDEKLKPTIDLPILKIPSESNISNLFIHIPISPSGNSVKSDDGKDTCKQFKNYKVLKQNSIELVSEPDKDIIEQRIKDIDIKLLRNKGGYEDMESYKLIFEELFKAIKDDRSYSKNMEKLSKTRIKLLGIIKIEEYRELTLHHIKIMEDILKHKSYIGKRLKTTITKSLNGLEARIIFYGNYYDLPIETEDFSRLKSCIKLNVKSNSFYSSFNNDNLINLFFNYGSVLIPLKSIIECYLFNDYGFNNVIYVPLNQSTEQDPYSFYTLEGVSDLKRYWKMDCRLFELSEFISNNLKSFLINIFRKIYQDIFSDNEYREDFGKKTEITSKDFEQLLQNILLLSNLRNFCGILQELVIKKAIYYPTENDRFNIYGDDTILKKKFNKNKENNDYAEVIKSLFDNMSSEQAVDLYRSKSYLVDY